MARVGWTGFLLLLAAVGPVQAAGLTVARDGAAAVGIVLARGATPAEATAAQELVDYLGKVTGGKPFAHEHRNGYGMKVFGADGPVSEFADALEACQEAAGKGKLALTLRRGTGTKEVVLD